MLVNLCLVHSQICSPTNKEEYKHNELSQILTSLNPHSLKFTPMSCTKQQMIIYNGKTLHISLIYFFIKCTMVPFHVQHKLNYFFECQNFRKLRSFLADFLKNYCLLKLKFHRIPKLFFKNLLCC